MADVIGLGLGGPEDGYPAESFAPEELRGEMLAEVEDWVSRGDGLTGG